MYFLLRIQEYAMLVKPEEARKEQEKNNPKTIVTNPAFLSPGRSDILGEHVPLGFNTPRESVFFGWRLCQHRDIVCYPP